MADGESNGNVIDDVTWPKNLGVTRPWPRPFSTNF